jgi:hypothetical protein
VTYSRFSTPSPSAVNTATEQHHTPSGAIAPSQAVEAKEKDKDSVAPVEQMAPMRL